MLYYCKRFIKRLRVRAKYPRVVLRHAADVGLSATFEGPAKIGKWSRFDGDMGRCSYLGDFCWMNEVQIGRYCSVSSFVKVFSGRHPLRFVSTSPVFYSTQRQCGTTYTSERLFDEYAELLNGRYAVVIGNDVWIGADARLMEGVRIGDGAVVAAGALVNADVAPYAIVAGVPARVIGKRFDDETAARLVASEWWKLPEKELKDNAARFSDDIQGFLRWMEGRENGRQSAVAGLEAQPCKKR